MLPPKPITPEELALRWACSPSHVRKLIATGELPAFRLGGKLLRIKLADVEAFECSGTERNNGAVDAARAETHISLRADLRRLMRERRLRSSLAMIEAANVESPPKAGRARVRLRKPTAP